MRKKTIEVVKPFIIPVFIPHAGCPHRCVFCNQAPTTGRVQALPSTAHLHETIVRFLSYRRDEDRYTEISFYGGNFLGLNTGTIVTLLDAVSPYVARGQVNGIRFSTRPDTIEASRLDLIADYPVTTIEIGVQSMNDDVLELSRRGHTVRDVRKAAALLNHGPYAVGMQMMIGLPGDTPELALATGAEIAALGPDFVRIYPTLVLADSLLSRWYSQGCYTPMGLDDAVDVAMRLYVLFSRQGIDVIRMGLQPTDALNTGAAVLAGPFHPAFGEMVYSALWFQFLCSVVRPEDKASGHLDICVHPRRLSRIKGNKNSNIEKLKKHINLTGIRVSSDWGLPLDGFLINGRRYQMMDDPIQIG